MKIVAGVAVFGLLALVLLGTGLACVWMGLKDLLRARRIALGKSTPIDGARTGTRVDIEGTVEDSGSSYASPYDDAKCVYTNFWLGYYRRPMQPKARLRRTDLCGQTLGEAIEVRGQGGIARLAMSDARTDIADQLSESWERFDDIPGDIVTRLESHGLDAEGIPRDQAIDYAETRVRTGTRLLASGVVAEVDRVPNGYRDTQPAVTLTEGRRALWVTDRDRAEYARRVRRLGWAELGIAVFLSGFGGVFTWVTIGIAGS